MGLFKVFFITSKEVGSKDFTFFFCSKLLASEKILWRKPSKKWQKTRKNGKKRLKNAKKTAKNSQKTIKNSRKTTKNRAKNALNSWKNVRIKPFLAQKRASKTAKTPENSVFFCKYKVSVNFLQTTSC